MVREIKVLGTKSSISELNKILNKKVWKAKGVKYSKKLKVDDVDFAIFNSSSAESFLFVMGLKQMKLNVPVFYLTTTEKIHDSKDITELTKKNATNVLSLFLGESDKDSSDDSDDSDDSEDSDDSDTSDTEGK